MIDLMDTVKVAKKHQEIRDKAIEKKLKAVLVFLDNEQIKQEVFNKIFKKYVPSVDQMTEEVIKRISSGVEIEIRNRVEELSQSISDQKIDKKIYDEVRRQIKYIFSGVVEEIEDL